MQVGVDTGGTFTDLVTATGEVVKVLSTPDDPARAIGAAVGAATPAADDRPALLAHGTTVATNALLERRGATVALVTTEGLRDVVEIGRQDRPSLYDQLASRPEPLVARRHRYEVAGRLAADGHGAGRRSTPTRCRPSRPTSTPWPCACCTPTCEPAHERAVAAVLRAAGPRRDLLARGVARDARGRADDHHRDQRRAAAPVPRLPAGHRRPRPTRCWS